MNLETANPTELFNHLWQTKYEPQILGKLNREAELRAEAFANFPVTVCEEELRLMTARDLLMLDGLESPFVTGQGLPEKKDVAFFVWMMSTRNRGKGGIREAYWRGRVYGRILREERDVAFDVAEIELYCERIFIGMDTSEPKEGETARLQQKPPQVYFLAPLLVRVAGKIGSHDPMDGKLLADIPLPRLLQYQKAIMEDDPNYRREDFTAFDSQRSLCLEEVNKIVAARNQKTG